jgi:hypothetical protein
MMRYLNGNHIQVLYAKLPKTEELKNIRSEVTGRYDVTMMLYGAGDAQMYLEWLISVVQSYEQSSDEIRTKAYDQLCRFILILTDVTQWKDGYVLAKPYDWTNRLQDFESEVLQKIEVETEKTAKELETYQYKIDGYTKQLDDLTEAIDEKSDTLTTRANELKTISERLVTLHETQTNDLASMLRDVLVWMKKYGSVLDRIERDYQVVTKPQGKGKTN